MLRHPEGSVKTYQKGSPFVLYRHIFPMTSRSAPTLMILHAPKSSLLQLIYLRKPNIAFLQLLHHVYMYLQILELHPKTLSISRRCVLTKLKKNYGVYPQIACNQKDELQEIRFCFFLEGSAFYKDCPNKLEGNNYCNKENDEITFPSSPGMATKRNSEL
ncbi:hypothetical protein Gogos_021231 [Gossypium gossypioides]|uniref:Uncharacterized protein n=1 Tax=Gossypium gossypioides TaxID=34282 RepID=A0A7J9D402_GOSGO|nr:hypothetical protein [Gossypium gossypioides]